MLKHFVCMLIIFAFFMTIQSNTRSDNDIYNEDEQLETRYYDYNHTWKITQYGRDSEGQLQTSAYISANQSRHRHSLYAYTFFYSSYSYPKIQGSWYVRAQLHHDWATDEEPYENRGKIKGKAGGVGDSGSQSDADFWADHDPSETINSCDAYAEATAYHPSKNASYRSVAYAPFTPTETKWIFRSKP